MRTRRGLCAAVLLAGTILTGCTSGHGGAQPGTAATPAGAMMPGMVMPDGSTAGAGAMTPGMVMPDGSTMAPGSPGTGPSAAAQMICTTETQADITTVLSVAPDPKPVSTWRGGTYTCTYRVPMGSIVLSVHESADAAAAAAYTTALRPSLPGAKDLVGLTDIAFGANGLVALQKDNDTLRVDMTGLRPQSKLYAHRADFAYEIAAVIMGCWTGSPVG